VNGGDESKGILLMGFKYNNEISSNCLQVNWGQGWAGGDDGSDQMYSVNLFGIVTVNSPVQWIYSSKNEKQKINWSSKNNNKKTVLKWNQQNTRIINHDQGIFIPDCYLTYHLDVNWCNKLY
jgi:hypothetical protein